MLVAHWMILNTGTIFFLFSNDQRQVKIGLTPPEVFYCNGGKNDSKSCVLEFHSDPSVMSPRFQTKSIGHFFFLA